ncbi:MAG: hypothetical protein HQM13_10230 [SAR324 cluster bacterium]|nr:hypothetical protein [SAR324 cluster bacterium]
MTFKEISAKYLEPLSMWVMILGIIGISQPWSEWFHRYGFTITLMGFVGFIIFSHIQPPKKRAVQDEG